MLGWRGPAWEQRGCPAQGEAGREALRAIVGSGEYFVAMLPDGSRLVQPIPRGVRHPLNFGREARPPRCLGNLYITCSHWRRGCFTQCISKHARLSLPAILSLAYQLTCTLGGAGEVLPELRRCFSAA